MERALRTKARKKTAVRHNSRGSKRQQALLASRLVAEIKSDRSRSVIRYAPRKLRSYRLREARLFHRPYFLLQTVCVRGHFCELRVIYFRERETKCPCVFYTSRSRVLNVNFSRV